MKAAILIALLAGTAYAQKPVTAQWSLTQRAAANKDERVVTLHATIERGWHVYAATQQPGGPIPLLVRVEPSTPYQLAGAITGTVPQKHQDASFNLTTEYFTDAFSLEIPLRQTGPSQDSGISRWRSGFRCAATPLSAEARQQLERPAEQLLRYLVFANEASLHGLGFEADSDSAFARSFAAQGPRDTRGRSLRDFDLRKRTFRYPVSYLVYTDSFDSLPQPAKAYVYHRLLQVLTGEDTSAEFTAIAPQLKRAALEILLATKRGLPDEWQAYAVSNHLHFAGSTAPARHKQG